MNDSLFFRVLVDEDKVIALKQAIEDTSEGKNHNTTTYIANASSFSKIPGSTFAYWVSERTRDIFTKFSQLESEDRTVKQGLATADDFRFLRLWWEVPLQGVAYSTLEIGPKQFRQQTFLDRWWVPFAKGGIYSPYYSDVHLVIDWTRDGEELKEWICQRYEYLNGKWEWVVKNSNFYFRPGLTWPRRTSSGISIRVLPRGCIFADKGPAAFSNLEERNALLGLMNSKAFEGLIALQLGAADAAARSYEVGLIQNTPVPNLSSSDGARLGELAMSCVEIKRTLDTANEISHLFNLPALLQVAGKTLLERCTTWHVSVAQVESQISKYQQEINDIAFRLYDFHNRDRQAIEESLKSKKQLTEASLITTGEEEEDADSILSTDSHKLIIDLISYTIGCILGRWDTRFATGEKMVPELSDPFLPLPTCSPSMLIDDDNYPLQDTPIDYNLKVGWTGILVDDQEHLGDIVRSVRNVLELIWKNRAENIEQEICQILGLKELREYFRKPGKDNFWAHHLQRYTKSRRKAPIYWHLQSSKKNYSIWLYYHKLNKDMLFKALVNYVEPKLRVEEARLEQLQSQYKSAAKGSREARQLEKPIEVQGSFLAELKDFREKLRRVADLGLEPDLNDGVVLNIAPLRELVPWSEAKKYWEELRAGKYEWSSISKQLREKGLV